MRINWKIDGRERDVPEKTGRCTLQEEGGREEKEEACGGEGKRKGGKKNRRMDTYKIWREKMGNSLTQVHSSS